MPWGLLWYDEVECALEDKVCRAAERYIEKFGRRPDTCFVHPEWEILGSITIGDGKYEYKVIASPTVLKNHFWIGERRE